MSKLPERRIISIEVPGTGSPELGVALDGLRAIVEADGGRMFDRQVTREIDLLNDEDLRMVAACVEPMHQAGLLDPDKQVKDLVIGDPPQRFWDAAGYKGLNKHTVSDLAHTIDYGEKIETVPALLCMPHYGKRNVADKKLALLRQALVDSGMPEEFPWPWSSLLEDGPKFLRGIMLIAPTFEELPNVAKREVASILEIKPRYAPLGVPDLSDTQLEQCATIYAERRREILAIVGWEE